MRGVKKQKYFAELDLKRKVACYHYLKKVLPEFADYNAEINNGEFVLFSNTDQESLFPLPNVILHSYNLFEIDHPDFNSYQLLIVNNAETANLYKEFWKAQSENKELWKYLHLYTIQGRDKDGRPVDTFYIEVKKPRVNASFLHKILQDYSLAFCLSSYDADSHEIISVEDVFFNIFKVC